MRLSATHARIWRIRWSLLFASAGLCLALVPSLGASAAPVATQFRLTLQPATLLDYYSTVELNVDAVALAKLAAPVKGTRLPAKALTASAAGGALQANVAIVPGAGKRMNNVLLTIDNAWAVRALGSRNARTTVSVHFGSGRTATLRNSVSGGARIVLRNLSTTHARFRAAGLGAAAVQTGALRMRMNLSNATVAGSYGAADIVITATTN